MRQKRNVNKMTRAAKSADDWNKNRPLVSNVCIVGVYPNHVDLSTTKSPKARAIGEFIKIKAVVSHLRSWDSFKAYLMKTRSQSRGYYLLTSSIKGIWRVTSADDWKGHREQTSLDCCGFSRGWLLIACKSNFFFSRGFQTSLGSGRDQFLNLDIFSIYSSCFAACFFIESFDAATKNLLIRMPDYYVL